MKFCITREEAMTSLEDFVNNGTVNYSSKRNYDLAQMSEKMFPVCLHTFLTDF